jgi:hypothetical protein
MRNVKVVLAGLLAAVGLMAAMPAAFANDADIIRRGSCSGRSDWKLKLSPENGRIEVEYEVDQNRSGDTWAVRLRHNGDLFFSDSRTTQPPSGSFEVRRVVNNRAGDDRVTARATNNRTGEVCTGAATF